MNSFIKIFLLLIMLLLHLFCPYPLLALDPHKLITQYDTRVYTAKDGLPMTSLKNVFQDSRGYLWIGSQEGLIRFDGVEFKLYEKSQYPGLKCNFIWDIDEDAEGNLWVATNGGGISCFDGFSFTTYDTSNGLANNIVYKILVGRDSTVWAGTDDGLSGFKNGRFTHFSIEVHHLCANTIQSLAEDAWGNIFVGGYGLRGLSVIRNDSVKNFRHYFDVLALGKLRSGNMLVVSYLLENNELFIFKNDSLLKFNPPEILLNNQDQPITRDVMEDNDGNLWFCTEGRGILRLFDGKFDSLNIANGLPANNNYLDSVFQDAEGSLWFCGDCGLIQLKDNKFITFGKKEGLPSNYGTTVCEDAAGNIWVGFRDPGISKIYKYQVQNYLPEHNFPQYGTMVIIPDFNGDLWFDETLSGIFYWNKIESAIHYGLPERLYTPYVSSLLQTAPNTIWVGAWGYLLKLKNSKFQLFEIEPGQGTRSAITSILQTPNNEIWFGTMDMGFYKLTDETINRQSIPPELQSGGINALYQDDAGTIWIGTDNLGLYRFQNGGYTQFSVANGLFCDRLFSILEDDSLNLWCSTNRGIFKVSKQLLDDFSENKISKITCQVYNHLDGMRESECNGRRQPVAWKAQDGRLWFVSLAGVVTIDPNNIHKNEKEPPVYIESVTTPDRTYELRTNQLKLAARERDLEIKYTALSFAVPERVRFRYQLMGYDHDWIDADTRRSAFYTNLSKGKYTFKVIACNNDGVWNQKGVSIDFSIPPFWWETWWAYSGYFGILVFFIAWIVRRRYKRIFLKAQLQLQKEHAGRLEELDRTKSRFFAGISHEFRTPLTLIKGPLQDLLADTKLPTTRNLLQMMFRNTTRLERLVDQLLDISQLQHEKMALQVRPVRLFPFLKSIIAAFESYAKRKGILLKFSGAPATNPARDNPIAYLDPEKMEKVFINLLSNALKYTASGGEVLVKITSSEGDESSNKINISVKDTGKGIPAQVLPHIFDYFYRYRDESHQREAGSGIGLALSQELVKLHHGEINVISTEGQGSEFTVTLLPDKAHFKPEEIVDETVCDGPVSQPTDESTIPDIETTETEPSSSFEPPDYVKIKPGKKPTILVVEDNPDMRHYLVTLLEGRFSIIEAGDGLDGLKAARNSIPELVISDVMMPRLDGFQLCEKLKADKLTSHIPIILLTAKGSGESKIKGLEQGAVDYLTKPFEKQELILRIQNLLELQQAQQEYLRNQITAMDMKIARLQVASADEKFLQRAMEIIEKNIHDPEFNALIFAQKLGLSRVHLNRKLSGLVGQKTNEFIRTIRLKMAAKLLQNRAGTVSEIAYEVGFNHLSYFANCFKAQYGVLPSEYIH